METPLARLAPEPRAAALTASRSRPRAAALRSAAALAITLLPLALASADAGLPSKSPAATVGKAGPSGVLREFDSLMEARRFPEARRLCAGQMLRMFEFLALAQAKLAPYLDTARSTDVTMEEKSAGDWAYARIHSRMVFKKPFLGQDSLASVQAAHLYKAPRGWLIVEMEELESRDAPVHLRSGIPEGLDGKLSGAGPASSASAAPGRGRNAAGLFPVSARAPAQPGQADRIRYRLRLKSGGALAGACALDGGQTLIRAESPSQWILENRRPAFPGTAAGSPAGLAEDSARIYLASNAFLDLDDSLLRKRAGALAAGERDPARIAQAVYAWVTERFRFRMGSVLFGTSRETVRDMTGDCSEAAILTAALLRARGVPARVALGFASLGRGVFIGHAWCEAWLDGSWVGVDAALREFPAGAERVKLAALDGRSDMRIAATNLMMRTLSNLDIEMLGAWQQGRGLPLRAYPDNSAEAERYFQEILDGMDRAGTEPAARDAE